MSKYLAKYIMYIEKDTHPKGVAFEFLQIKLVHVIRSRNRAI